MNKQELRSDIRKKKRAMTEEEILSKSEALGKMLFESQCYKDAKVIYGYLPYN